MKKQSYTIMIKANPWLSSSALTAYYFCKALVEKQHEILQVFFVADGVLNSANVTGFGVSLVQKWRNIAKKQQLTLTVCSQSALIRGINKTNISQEFHLAGFARLFESMAQSDRFIVFG